MLILQKLTVHFRERRYGGKEFSLILPNTDQPGAVHVGNSLQAQVRDLQITHDGSAINQYVTMSLGVATIIPTWKSSTSDLIIKADKALYQAKSAGRNSIISN
ncbi:hypothetical protein A4S05_22360 [Nostoc sp. KVJ20]|uniref:diguanylate cyclase domain-containing protein n=1 Tax=Nostoc sp. KVJ20 TaxID=457944 RepID=UPI00083D524B|nr:hypothetical protein A4S05_22360 [Nostoc sp. KVJ20]